MPKIQYLFLILEEFPSGTILDLNMGYYYMNPFSETNTTIKVDRVCYGKYQYPSSLKRLSLE